MNNNSLKSVGKIGFVTGPADFINEYNIRSDKWYNDSVTGNLAALVGMMPNQGGLMIRE